MKRGLAALALLTALAAATPAWATDPTAGTSCTGPASGPISGSTSGGSVVMPAGGNNLVCVGGTWQYPAYQFGSTTASCNSTNAGAVKYTGGQTYLCNGTAWTALVQTQSTPPETAPSGSGYFVLSYGTYAANSQSTTQGFDSDCYTDLTTHTGWAGHSTASTNGYLTTTNIHAFVCAGGGCNQLLPLTTYYFANSQISGAGGAYFTTDSSGNGPQDNAIWSAANYFEASAIYWTGRGTASGPSTTIWGGDYYDLGAASPAYGIASNTDYTRWIYSYDGASPYGNSTALNLICYVNP